jgi:hypothetical protein
MKINIISNFTGKINKMDLPITEKQLYRWRYSHEHLKNVMPHLSPAERIFLETGMTEEEQKEFYGKNKTITNENDLQE